jgi:glycosyltransferase involved in cell wall biosynthesis
VIIPFRNAGRYIERLLESLCAPQTTEQWEIIASDNGSTDKSRTLLNRFIGRLPLTITDAAARPGPSFARNVGARVASGDKLLFIDADDEVAPGYVAALSDALNTHELVTSRVDSVSLNADWVRTACGSPWQIDCVPIQLDFLPAAGSNVGIRRGLFLRLGGFPEMFAGSEDVAFSWNACLAGAVVHFVPDALYRYRHRETLRSLLRQSSNWGRETVLLFRHYRGHGMPGRSLATAGREWRAVFQGLLCARGRAQSAHYIFRLGYCLGRIHGTIIYRVMYL